MAAITRYCDVRPGKREDRSVVRECRWFPGTRRMTRRARTAESPCNMVRICGAGKVCRMTLITVGVYKLVIPADVTGLARGRRVLTRQRELRRAVVER